MRMIFHLPFDLQFSKTKTGISGSYIRPQKMLQAFEELGYVVDTVWGRASERKTKINEIKQNVSRGIQYDFIYTESSTMPTLLTEPNHIPISPSIDFGFFRWAKKNGIPIGLFYRDIYWRFEHYKKQVSWYKTFIATVFYYFDLFFYYRLVDYLFLPNMKMLDELPGVWRKDCIYALPPGGCKSTQYAATTLMQLPLKLIYVGGVLPPLYDLSAIFQGLKGFTSEEVQLTLCCREQEWQKCKEQYELPYNNTIHIVHEHGDSLKQRYLDSNVALLLYRHCSYREFAMPIKMFEAISYGIPIISNINTAVGDFVEQEGIGWVIEGNPESFQSWLKFIIEHPEQIKQKSQIVKERAVYHTWQERAKRVAKILSGGLNNESCYFSSR